MIKRILLVAAVLAMATAFYEGSSPVIALTSDNYEQVNKGIWFVEYFASWCGHCSATWRPNGKKLQVP